MCNLIALKQTIEEHVMHGKRGIRKSTSVFDEALLCGQYRIFNVLENTKSDYDTK
jgi:hypothetical protein